MPITLAVFAVALVVAVLIFAASSVRGLPDPIDPVGAERAVARRLARHPRARRFLRQRMDRRAAGGFALTVALVVAFAAALVVGLVLDMVDRRWGLAGWDDNVAQWGVTHATSGTVSLLKVVTYFGETSVVVPAMLAAGVIDFLRHRRLDVFLFLGAVLGGEKLIANALKSIVNRARPDLAQLVPWDGPSFPSGHAAAAAMAWPAIALVLGRGLPRVARSLLAAAAGLIAAAVATSRALLGVHWLTDVIAGLVLGYGWFLCCAVVFGGRAQRLGDPIEAASVEPTGHR
ncbi:undecaprenyl-diphosphatase [Nakamurella panacisegetis]|uniref:Undecaprenyl-diphosphatase n=1 Tax=Nakamurella panacisegetis TaxID=1090615 RepID=A0A1H0S6Y7_9ACTN|nr:phosphatase PAP2 family protein [Nakamurella panacisegetis]SDP37299.1 undecaprenyl-diphosphatase [Nakamurella panacisegetis]